MPTFPPAHRIGSYRIIRLLGEGGMGAVYEARHEALDRRVALKTLLPEHASEQKSVARFVKEAKALGRLEHPSIVQASDFGRAPDGTIYLIMEYLRGVNLADRLRTLHARGERLPVATALQFAWQVADVLSQVHSQDIVHRDIKPENLMLVEDPIAPGGERVKVLDFGIAKLTADSEGGVKTSSQAVLGSPMYMSPEQCQGAGGVDEKSDVYSLGCVLYEMLAGRPPFVHGGALQILGQHVYQTPPSVASLAPKLPSALHELVHRLIAKDKDLRPSSSDTADELGALLTEISPGSSLVRSRIPAPERGAAPAASMASAPPVRAGPGQRIWRLPMAIMAGAATMVGLLYGVPWLHPSRKYGPAVALPLASLSAPVPKPAPPAVGMLPSQIDSRPGVPTKVAATPRPVQEKPAALVTKQAGAERHPRTARTLPVSKKPVPPVPVKPALPMDAAAERPAIKGVPPADPDLQPIPPTPLRQPLPIAREE